MEIVASECVAYEQGKFDTHAAFKDGVYTFVKTGEYIIIRKDGIPKKVFVSAGETVSGVKAVIGEHCGVFYTNLLQKVEK